MNPGLDIWQYAGDEWSDDDSDYYSDNNGYGSGSSRPPVVADQKVVVSDLKELTQDTHFILLPSTVRGFSFVLSEWGEFVVDSFSDITFDTGAFQHLEMDADHKQLLKALVESTQKEESKDKLITDVIAGKGSSCRRERRRCMLNLLTRNRWRYHCSPAWQSWSGEWCTYILMLPTDVPLDLAVFRAKH